MINFLLKFDVETSSFIQDVLRSLFLSIDIVVYKFFAFLYELFTYIVSVEFFQNETIDNIMQRIWIIIGVIALFNCAISIIRILVAPDTMNDKNKGLAGFIKRTLIAVVLLVSFNAIFQEAYDIQNNIIFTDNNNIVSKALGIGSTSNVDAGINLSTQVFFGFFTNGRYFADNYNINADDIKNAILSAYKDDSSVNASDSWGYLHQYVTVKTEVDGGNYYVYQYNYLISTAAGILLIYIMINYCFGVGIRVFKLIFLQLMAPLPIIMSITEKGQETLKKWGKQCLSTFLDVIIKLFIINLVIVFAQIVIEAEFTFAKSDEVMIGWAKIVLILSALLFAKKAMDMIKDIFPSMGDTGLGLKKMFKDTLAGKGFALAGSAVALGAGKLRAGIDARKNGFRFRDGASQVRANNKLRKWLDDTSPYSREQRKKQLEAGSNSFVRDKLIEDGRDNYWENNGTLTANSFSDQAYRNSWQSVEDAKSAVKTAETEMAVAQSELNAAYSSHDPKAIENATARYEKAQKTLKSANGVLEYRKQRHDDMKKLHSDDARIEDSFDAYKKATSAAEKANDEENYKKNKGRGGNSSNGSSPQGPDISGATGNGVAGDGVTRSNEKDNDDYPKGPFFGDDGGESGE